MTANDFNKLPELARPSLYQICISLNLDTCEFNGHENIQLEVTKPTDHLTLHSNALQVKSASLKLEDGNVLSDLKCDMDSKWSLLTVHLPETIKPQKAELAFVYGGQLSTNMHGFYKSTYNDSEGNEQTLASTQFESTYARCAFPCWDEPIYKAKFDIKLEVDSRLTVLSNMNAVGEETRSSTGTTGTKKLITFDRTPLMSTYLVAFAVGQFEFVESITKSGCVMRVYTIPGKKEQGNYALEVAVKAMELFTEWFDLKMPLSKCDVLALPDFDESAMENWGLITARENTVLYDPAKSSSSHRQSITMTLSHEISHFWFGNLVTMKWWSDLWLKEGFASFMEYLFVDKNYPEFNAWSHFVDSEVTSGMSLDCLRSSHPIEVPIQNPNELDEIFDDVTYSKSNSIIRMLFNHLGEPTFQRGLRAYLYKHQYANADTDDLWQCLSDASAMNIKALMSSWIRQTGFPLVTVEDTALEGDRRELHLKQTRFLSDGSRDEADPIWQVPFDVTTAAQQQHSNDAKFLLLKSEEKFIIEGVKPTEWVKLNSNFTSFFRVQYSQNMLTSLLNGMNSHELGALDRFQLADDLYALVEPSRVPITHFLAFLTACCPDEMDYFVWSSINAGIANIGNVLKHLEDGRTLLGRFERFVCDLVEPVVAKLGWEPMEGEDMHIGRLRALLINRLSRCGHQPTIQMALRKFNALVHNGVAVVPDLRTTIFRTVCSSTNDPEIVAALKHLLETSNYSQVEISCIIALGACADIKQLEANFEYGVIQGKIRDQDIGTLFAATHAAPTASSQHFAWQFLQQNIGVLDEKYGGVHASLFQQCMKMATTGFCSTVVADEIMKFFANNMDEHSLSILERPLQQIVETIKLNERLLTNNVYDLDKYLEKMGY